MPPELKEFANELIAWVARDEIMARRMRNDLAGRKRNDLA